jgi:hypothetical protein
VVLKDLLSLLSETEICWIYDNNAIESAQAMYCGFAKNVSEELQTAQVTAITARDGYHIAILIERGKDI